jgi:hypothetical protein
MNSETGQKDEPRAADGGALPGIAEQAIGGGRVLAQPSPTAVREELVELVLADLLGPLGGDDEEFAESPTDRYLLGRLAPSGGYIVPEEMDELADSQAPTGDEGDREPETPSVPSTFPAALGFTVRVSGEVRELRVSARWARYVRAESSTSEHTKLVWKRVATAGETRVPLVEGRVLAERPPDPEQPQVVVCGRARRHEGAWLVSLFLVNAINDERQAARNWLFQVELAATAVDGAPVFLPRPALAEQGGDLVDQQERHILAMGYRFRPEFAVGHGCGVHTEADADDPCRATLVRTATVPSYEMPATDVPSPANEADGDLPELADLVLDMERLADLDGPGLRAALLPLVDGYRRWIDRNEASLQDPANQLDDYASAARRSLAQARRAADRIEAGINLLAPTNEASHPAALAAFQFANRAMRLQRVHTIAASERRRDPSVPLASAVRAADRPANRSWRPFQLAFILLNMPSLTDPAHAERSADPKAALADLLWFPTGGGKTEAYLGLTAYTLAIRRLLPTVGGLDATTGVAVLMRYTLRLLTIQQFQRAATLICACETLRRADEARWGDNPFRIGLWVGGAVTPNRTDVAEEWLVSQKRSSGAPRHGQGSPHQLTSCPWCGEVVQPGRDITVDMGRRRTLVFCPDLGCPFGAMGGGDGLPVVLVDEEIYRLLPSLLIATVDKFAQLPWRGETIALFGRVRERCERHGYVSPDLNANDWERASHQPAQDLPAAHTVTVTPPRPPDLIIQDELHLISGPLGSLVGLYETAVDRLASWDLGDGHLVRPKVIASTATVRRAPRQIGALFNRVTEVFPPPGLDVADNFFARQRPVGDRAGRRYIGICAQGVRSKSTLIRLYVAVLGAAQLLHERYGRNPVTDPYMTLVGYFNSLRELGAMRRLVEDDVTTRLGRAHERGLARRRDPLLHELTSRMSSDQVPEVLDLLGVSFSGRGTHPSGPRPVDVLLATNMIAVGVDVSRLGVMVVANQPKSTAEYIQATSRVGRSAPGLVFTVFSWARPRDLSHYETFESFHASVYRHVEALSVTPFADRALDRGLSGVLVALARDLRHAFNGNRSAQYFDVRGELADHVHAQVRRRGYEVIEARRAGDAPASARQARSAAEDVAVKVDAQVRARYAHWERERERPGVVLAYRRPRGEAGGDAIGLLSEPDDGPWRLMTCPTSLREVEPGIRLLLTDALGPEEVDKPSFEPRELEPDTAADLANGEL